MTSIPPIGNLTELRISDNLPDHGDIQEKLLKVRLLWESYSWKSTLPADYPLIVSLIGGTGTGKSAIFNSMAGSVLSRTAPIRPCTGIPVAIVPEQWRSSFEESPALKPSVQSSKEPGAEMPVIKVLAPPTWETDEVILVDTPDYDSVESDHVALATNIFVISDMVILVTSKEKYADMAVTQMAERAADWNKQTAHVINMTEGGDTIQDFEQKTKKEVIALMRIPGSPETLPQISQARDPLALFEIPREVETIREVRKREIHNLKVQVIQSLEELLEPIKAHQERIESICDHLDTLVEVTAKEMFGNADRVFNQDLEKRARLQLNRALRKYDFLYGPRKKIRDLFGSALDKASKGWLGWGASTDQEKKEEMEADLKRSWSETHEAPVMRALTRFDLQVAERLANDESLDYIRRTALKGVESLDHVDIREHMREVVSRVDRVLKDELTRFEKGLSTKEEITLYGSYTVSALALLVAEVALGGGFGAVDVVLTGVIAPFIPKVALSAKVIDLLRDLGRRVDSVYQAGLKEILEERAQHYKDSFRELIPTENEIGSLELALKELKE